MSKLSIVKIKKNVDNFSGAGFGDFKKRSFDSIKGSGFGDFDKKKRD